MDHIFNIECVYTLITIHIYPCDNGRVLFDPRDNVDANL
jgi:hypothetical protein